MAVKKYLDQAGTQQVVDWTKNTYVQKESGKGLSTNDFTTAHKEAIDNLPTTYAGIADTDAKFTKKVDKVDGKGLSTNDFTTADKQKLQAIQPKAEVNKIDVIKRNGTVIAVASKTVDIKVPIDTKELTNGAGYVTNDELTTKLSKLNTLEVRVVTELPPTGEKLVMYLVKKTAADTDSYTEYIWVGDKYEKLGETATKIDLSGYLTKSEVQALSTTEIDKIITGA